MKRSYASNRRIQHGRQKRGQVARGGVRAVFRAVNSIADHRRSAKKPPLLMLPRRISRIATVRRLNRRSGVDTLMTDRTFPRGTQRGPTDRAPLRSSGFRIALSGATILENCC